MGSMSRMKTTLELPDDLLRELKLRAVQEDRRMKDVVAEALRLSRDRREGSAGVRHRVELPLVLCEAADPAREVTPERAAALLLADEAGGAPPP